MLEIKNLAKTFGTKIAVDRLSFTVEDSDIMGFIGKNGAGKTTTMKLPAASCGVSARDSLRSSLVCCAASCGELNPLWD